MYALANTQLDTYLDRIVNNIQQLRQLDFTNEAAVEQAMAQSQQVMGTLAMYRHQLRHAEARIPHPMRRAA